MKISLIKTILPAAVFFCASSASAIIELDVVSIIPPTVGVQNTSSTVTATIGDTASYELQIHDTVANTFETAYLQVELTSKGAGLDEHWISDGQGGNTSNVGIALFGAKDSTRTGTYTFSFYSDAAYTTPRVLGDFTMQIADIDDVETVSVNDSEFSSVSFSGTTQLSESNPGSTIEVTNIVGENITKSNPDAVANFNGVTGLSSFAVTLTGFNPVAVGGREFQFDFTPDIVVPEPSTYSLLAGMLALISVMLRRRQS